MISRAEYEELLAKRKKLQREVRAFHVDKQPLTQREYEVAVELVQKINKKIDELNETADEIERYRREYNEMVDHYNQQL